MLISGDDISNDVITLGKCFSMFVYIRVRLRFALIGGNLTAQSTGSHKGIEDGIQISETSLQTLLPFPTPPPESPGELARMLITRPLLLWNWEISCEWQNHSLVSNKCLPSIISNLSNNKNKGWKTFRLASFSFKNRNCNLFQASCLSIYAFGIYFVTCTFFNALSGYIYLLLSFGSSNCLNFDEFGLLGSLKASIGCIWKEFYKFQLILESLFPMTF